jgi:hypothetical protein
MPPPSFAPAGTMRSLSIKAVSRMTPLQTMGATVATKSHPTLPWAKDMRCGVPVAASVALHRTAAARQDLCREYAHASAPVRKAQLRTARPWSKLTSTCCPGPEESGIQRLYPSQPMPTRAASILSARVAVLFLAAIVAETEALPKDPPPAPPTPPAPAPLPPPPPSRWRVQQPSDAANARITRTRLARWPAFSRASRSSPVIPRQPSPPPAKLPAILPTVPLQLPWLQQPWNHSSGQRPSGATPLAQTIAEILNIRCPWTKKHSYFSTHTRIPTAVRPHPLPSNSPILKFGQSSFDLSINALVVQTTWGRDCIPHSSTRNPSGAVSPCSPLGLLGEVNPKAIRAQRLI